MSQLPVNATGLSRRELRKAVIRLRLEMQRQQLRRESQLLVQPFRQAQGLGHNLSQQLFGGGNAALWGAGGAALLGVLLGKGGRWQRLLRLGVALAPLLLGLRKQKAVEGCADRQRSAPSVSPTRRLSLPRQTVSVSASPQRIPGIPDGLADPAHPRTARKAGTQQR